MQQTRNDVKAANEHFIQYFVKLCHSFLREEEEGVVKHILLVGEHTHALVSISHKTLVCVFTMYMKSEFI